MADARFVELPLDKHAWSPSPLPGQVVLVATRDEEGVEDVAPKSWVTMAAFSGPVLGFGCNTAHATFRNILATGEFVINVPGASMADIAWAMLDSHGAERIARSGLTLGRGRTVAAPVVLECAAHMECRLVEWLEFEGGECFVFGTISALAVDRAALGVEMAAAYGAIAPFFFVEDDWYAPLGRPRRVRHAHARLPR